MVSAEDSGRAVATDEEVFAGGIFQCNGRSVYVVHVHLQRHQRNDPT